MQSYASLYNLASSARCPRSNSQSPRWGAKTTRCLDIVTAHLIDLAAILRRTPSARGPITSITPTMPTNALVPIRRSVSGPRWVPPTDRIPPNDPLRELPLAVQSHLVVCERIHTAAQLLAWPDARIRALPDHIHGCGPRAAHQIAEWLHKMRLGTDGEGLRSADIELEALREARSMRERLGCDLIAWIDRREVDLIELAARAKTSQETFQRLRSEPATVTLDTQIRVAVALGLQIRAGLTPAPLSQREPGLVETDDAIDVTSPGLR